ncbi:MAG: 23S rRNA (pseudouridine(1915)-N(3))-methyltransferase RlmH, partial [Candidatus Absconditabacterales bacterium]
EYSKRLGKMIQIINHKPSKKDTIAQIVQEDTSYIIDKLKNAKTTRDRTIVLLSKDGVGKTTEQWKGLLEDTQNNSQDLIFLIGGPYGFDEKKLKGAIDLSLSFGSVTMPHGLVKLVLLEQIYRCMQIIDGKQYHY